MSSALKYIVDDNRHKTSVLVPVKIWENLNERYRKLNKKLAVLTGIEKGLLEVKEAKRTGKNLQTLSDANLK